MKIRKSLMFFLVLFLQSSLLSQVTEEWVRRYNNPDNGPDHSHDMALDNYGNVYVTGHSNFINSQAAYDYITVKYSNQGNEQWVARYTGPFSSDDAYGIAVDNSGNVYVTGASENSLFVNDFVTVKYNSNGIEQWVRRYNGSLDSNDEAYQVVIDNNGDIFVSGTANIGTQSEEGLVIKYSADGSLDWIKSFSSGVGVTVADNNSNVLISGPALVKLNPQGNILWQIRDTLTRYGVVKIDNNQNIIVSKYKYVDPNFQLHISKYTQNGTLIQETPLTELSLGMINSLSMDLQENIYAGYINYTSKPNVFIYSVAKFNPSGSVLWQRSFNGGSYFRYIGIRIDQQNKLYISYTGGVGENTDFVTLKMDGLGNTLWQMTYNGSANHKDSPGDMELDNEGNVFVTGYSEANVTGLDYCVIKYSQLIGIKPISSEIPSHFSLSQNYPNPFNPATKIKFSLPLPSVGGVQEVNIVVYDILGREIKSLVNEHLQPGTYEVEWEASNHPSGVYLYRLIAGDFTETKKMVLVK